MSAVVSEYNFFQNQRDSAQEILGIQNAGNRLAALYAQMQSGKTGALLFVAFEAIRLSLVDNILIFGGQNDCELRDQMNEDFKKAKKAYRK